MINSNFLFKPRQKGTGFLTWTAAFNVYAAIDLKVTFEGGTRVSIDSVVRNEFNGTPTSIMVSTVK